MHGFVPMERLSLMVFDEGEWPMHPSQFIRVLTLLFHFCDMLGPDSHVIGSDTGLLWFDRLGSVIRHRGILSS